MKLSAIDSKIFGKVCYGFRRDKKGIVEVIPKEAEIIQKIFELYLSGYSLENIQNNLREYSICSPSGKHMWSRDVLNKLLNNYKYTFGIISHDTFFKVESIKTSNCRNPNRTIEDVDKWDEQQKWSFYGHMQ